MEVVGQMKGRSQALHAERLRGGRRGHAMWAVSLTSVTVPGGHAEEIEEKAAQR